MRRRKTLRILVWIISTVVLGIALLAWKLWPQVDEIPDELAEVAAEVSIPDLALEAQAGLPTVRIGDLRGKTVFLMIEGRESMTGGEGKLLHRAVHRWQLPDDVVGFSVGDAQGAGLFRTKIEKDVVGPMQAEMKLPIYMDYEGSFISALSLPKGHLGFAIIDAEGELVFRHSGDADEAKLAEIKSLLRAEEPPPGPPAPDFSIAGLDREACRGKRCVLIFLDRKIVRADIPGLEEGGFEGDMKEVMAQMTKPSVRLAQAIATDWDKAESSHELSGVIIGEIEGWEVEGWPVVTQAPEAREAFGLGAEAAMVILDDQGRVAFSETGVLPLWKLMLAADLLGIERKPRKERG